MLIDIVYSCKAYVLNPEPCHYDLTPRVKFKKIALNYFVAVVLY